MSVTKLIFAGVISFGAVTASAQAADVVDQSPEIPQPTFEEAVKGGWQGAYAGIYSGFAKGKFGNTFNIPAKGFDGGAFAGYNLQNGLLVYGFDSDLGASRVRGSSGGVAAKQGIDGSLRLRLGYDLGPVMIYGAAGGIATNAKINTASQSASNVHLGYTVGAGADIKLTDNLFARAEYRYNSYGAKSYALGSPSNVNFHENEFRIGFGVKF